MPELKNSPIPGVEIDSFPRPDDCTGREASMTRVHEKSLAGLLPGIKPSILLTSLDNLGNKAVRSGNIHHGLLVDGGW
jgi:hypothetical protein